MAPGSVYVNMVFRVVRVLIAVTECILNIVQAHIVPLQVRPFVHFPPIRN